MTSQLISVKGHPLIQLPETLAVVRHAPSIGNLLSPDDRTRHELANHAYPLVPELLGYAKQVACTLRELFGPNYFDICLYSTYVRTFGTLENIRREFRPTEDAYMDCRIDERWDGIFYELPQTDIQELYPEQVRLKSRTGLYHYRSLSGESCPDVEIRIMSLLRDLHLTGKKRVLIIGHGTWMLILRRLLEGWPVHEYERRRKTEAVKNCSLHVYRTSLARTHVQTTLEIHDPVPEGSTHIFL